ncbi:MAG: tyrosine-type recombinase/integrase [Protaetiibacter sp.]
MRVDERVTLREFHAAYAPLLHEGLTSNAIAAYDRAWRLRVEPSLGGVPLRELRPLVIANARAAWDCEASTKGDAVALLSRLLGLAVMDGLIASNPCRSLPRARGKALDSDPVARALTDAQVARMLDLTAPHPFGQRALAGLAFTGLRLGELVGLRWEDVDVARGLITVRRTYSPDGHGRLQVRATKSGRVRSVPLLDELLPWLDAARGTGYERVFTGVRGGPFDSGNLSRAVRWPVIRDDIATFADGMPLRFHDLRHTFLSRMARIGVTPANLQRVAGHASITTTELYTRSSAVEAALAVGELVKRVNREVTLGGGEAAQNRRMTGTFDR